MQQESSTLTPHVHRRRQAAPVATKTRTQLVIEAADPLSRAGIINYVSGIPGMLVISSDQLEQADIIVVETPILNGSVMKQLRTLTNVSKRPLVLVLDRIGEIHLHSAVEIGVAGILWRSKFTAERFTDVLLTVTSGGHSFPPEIQTRLVTDIARLRRDILAPHGLTTSGLNNREIEVLRLIADGLDTAEISERIVYSERTVKAILHGVLNRLHLNNRSQAVAYAIRAGLF
jgi:DNA-binding NarL/FixJ family response regulator